MKGESETPSRHHLFHTAEDATKIYQINAELLHHIVAQLLYPSNRAQPDIKLEIYFLCNIVIYTDVDDYKKLAGVIKYIQGTIVLPLIISIYKYGNIKWYVDT